jgi:energy-coupling factor transporter ATP-binding protein EcfA2
MLNNYKLTLPTKDRGNVEIETSNSLLFVGANGAGKTRLGTWIEFNSPDASRVHRISAQKSLAMPDTSTPTAIDLAETDLLFGNPIHGRQNKKAYRWADKPSVSLLSDFEKLMVYLFSDHTEESAKYLTASKATDLRVSPPTTKLDKVKKVWETILPHRKLIIGGLRIQTSVSSDVSKTYNSSEMSDGERVVFYLIGQCLAAPQNGIIVVDEPELHLHKSIQTPLWTAIEHLRPDCLFIYLTHDVDFAAAKESSKKIWLKSFDGTVWEWEPFNSDDNIPEDLLLEILGSRKPVVFVEGINGSYDSALYTAILKDFLVIPVGSCSQVIQSVKALKANSQLHHLNVSGIIDRDRRVPAEIQKLEQESIFVLSVAEVENLFCTREVLEIVSNRLARDHNADFQAVSGAIFARLQGELETQVSLRAASEIKFQLNMFDEKAKGATALTSALQSLAGGIDVGAIYSQTLVEFNTVILGGDFEGLLAIYNRKSLSAQAGSALGLANGSLPELVVRLAKGDCRDAISSSLKRYFGNFAPRMA